MESFYSIQGEGFHSGKPAYFIRLSGCDVNCHWCDVKESWEISKDQYMHIDDITNIKTACNLPKTKPNLTTNVFLLNR